MARCLTFSRSESGPAVDLYNGGRARLLILSGHRGEAEGMAARARALGVPDSAVRVEPNAQNTYQNATYCAAILAAEDLASAWIVSQPFHLKRALLCFRKQGIAAMPFVLQNSIQFENDRRALVWLVREYGAWAKHFWQR